MCYSDADGYERVPDYTRMLNNELDRIIYSTDWNLFIQDEPNASISFVVENLPTYWYLLTTMQDGDQFDYKNADVWRERFPGASIGANGEEFIFRGMGMTSEAFGNFAYGYYCTALGLPKLHILQAAGAYKVGKNLAGDAEMTFMEFLKTRGGIDRIMEKMYESEMNKWNKELVYPNEWFGGNDPNDHYWIVKGIYEYEKDMN